MRKPIVGALSTAFLLGMTASAMAVSVEAPPETTPVVAMGNVKVILDGNVRMRGFMQQDTINDDNYTGTVNHPAVYTVVGVGENGAPIVHTTPAYVTHDGPTNSSGDLNAFDGRVQLGATVKAGDGVTGRILLQTGDATSDVYGWGDGNSYGLFKGGSKQGGAQTSYVTNGSTKLSLLEGWVQYQPCNVGVKVGHMRLAEGNGLFFEHGGNSASGDDAAVIFGELVNGANLTGGYIKFEEGLQYDHRDDLDGYFGIYNQKVNDAITLDANLTYLHKDNKADDAFSGMKFYNLGVDGAFKLGIVDLSADFEYQFGNLEEMANGDKLKAKGYAAQVKATANLKPFTVGALIGYGSGDKGDQEDEYGQFVNFLTDTAYQVVIPGYRQAVPGMGGQLDTGLANMTVYQLFATAATTCPLSGKPVLFEARVSKMLLNETDHNSGLVNANGVTQDDLGVELAAFATWSLTKTLAYKIELAYLFAGDAWDATAINPNPDNAYFMRHTLELNF